MTSRKKEQPRFLSNTKENR